QVAGGPQTPQVVGAAAQGDHPGGAVVGEVDADELLGEGAVEEVKRRIVAGERALAGALGAKAGARAGAGDAAAGSDGHAGALAVADAARTALLIAAGVAGARQSAGVARGVTLAREDVADLSHGAGIRILSLTEGDALVVDAPLVGLAAGAAAD